MLRERGGAPSSETRSDIKNFMKSMHTTTQVPSAKATRKDTRVVDGLNMVLADSYALMGLTHQAHWNVEGSDFFPLHKAFQEQYEQLFEAIDEIAERVRALDSYAAGGLGKLARMAEMDEFTAPLPQQDYVAGLIVAHEKLVEDALHTRDSAGEAHDLETQDLMIKRIAAHQKTVWMLKSYLKH
jgi:starvation-inducible DNA-binding protein